MISLIFFSLTFATLSAYDRSIDPRLQRTTGRPDWKYQRGVNGIQKGETVIENKNVNIIVNVDPKDVAKELWALIQARLEDRPTRRSLPSEDSIEELEKIVTPVVSPSRRSKGPLNPFQVSRALDRVTRQALLGNRVGNPAIEDEIDTAEIVARMLFKLKMILDAQATQNKLENGRTKLQLPPGVEKLISIDDSSDSDVVKITLNLKKTALLQGNVVYASEDS